jgi:hypothetical protein
MKSNGYAAIPQRLTKANGIYRTDRPMLKIIHGTEPTKVEVQCSKTALKTSAKTKADKILFLLLEMAYMCAAIAIGALHHMLTGSKAVLSRKPEAAESRKFTNLKH